MSVHRICLRSFVPAAASNLFIRPVGSGNVTAIFVAAVLLIMVGLDSTCTCSHLHRLGARLTHCDLIVYIATVLYRNWRALRGSDRPGQIPFSLVVRVAIFSFVCVVGIGCAFVFLSNVSYFAGNIIISLSESELHIHNAMPVF